MSCFESLFVSFIPVPTKQFSDLWNIHDVHIMSCSGTHNSASSIEPDLINHVYDGMILIGKISISCLILGLDFIMPPGRVVDTNFVCACVCVCVCVCVFCQKFPKTSIRPTC